MRSTGGLQSRVSSGSSYTRTIVPSRASPWFEEYWTPLGSFGQAPLDGDQVYFWAAAHVAGAAEAVARSDLAAFRQEWRRILPAAADLLERVSSVDDLLINTVRRVDCRRWFSGRLVLLSDAAHAMAPNLGAGANSALADGVVLAEELAGAPSVMDALAGYDKRRRRLAGGCKRRPGCCSASAASSESRPCAYGTLCWRDWPGYRGSAKRPSVGASPQTSELLDRHPCSTRAEPPNRRPLTLRRRERRSESCRSASEISPLQDACVDLK